MKGPKVILHKKEFTPITKIQNKTTLNNIKEASTFNKKFENDMFLSLLKQTKKTQLNTLMNLKKEKKPSRLKLPKNLKAIDEDPYLSATLLKNPEFMSVDEKTFIDSFNREERIIFIQFLKMKSLERNWMGNCYGTGKYLENYLQYKKKEDEKKLPNFKSYLKGFFNNAQEKNMTIEKKRKQHVEEEIQNNEYNTSKAKESLSQKQSNLNMITASRALIKKELQIYQELEDYSKNILQSKCEAMENKLSQQNKIIENSINNKKHLMKEDIEKINSTNKDKYKSKNTLLLDEVSSLVKNYKTTLNNNKNKIDTCNVELKKIRDFKDNHSMTSLELIKYLDPESYVEGKIRLDTLFNNLIKYKILTSSESTRFINFFKENFDKEQIKNEIFEAILEEDVRLSKRNVYSKDDEKENEAIMLDLMREYNAVKDLTEVNDIRYLDSKKRYSLKNNVLSSRNLGEFQYIIKMKMAIYLQAKVRAFLMRSKVYKEILKRKQCAGIINKNARKYLLRKHHKENKAAIKIQLLLKRNHAMLKRENLLSDASQFWLLTGKKELTRNFAATTIQRYYRLYKNKLIYKYRNKNKNDIITDSLIKTKFCFICKENMVNYICKDCGNTNYCKLDFERYHSKGMYRNHKYFQVQKEKGKEYGEFGVSDVNTNVLMLKDFLKRNSIILYDHLKLWDFNHNSYIKLRHLKDALSVRFFSMDKEMVNTIINLSYKFIVDDNVVLDECYLNYEEMCLELID